MRPGRRHAVLRLHAREPTSRYGVDRLVWYEVYDRIIDAIAREKMLKKWRRDWKICLIEEDNPNRLYLDSLLNQ